ncbi:hypothetical protein [Rathayibacter rathayi]|uniref:hypothetical protein n=1 Tax=Rathayibacter rathayi TaxID=33887 RepID=UPI000CE786C4|nr:hypothetical protein [Rathayibacter rathayi]PPH34143.1 hypothetical protein C5C28_10055 [Rathayibacter rathayi]
MEELVTGESELEIADDGTLISDQVPAGLLTKGDVFQTPDGGSYSVDSIDEDFAADEIIITITDGSQLTFGAMDVVERAFA